jgi:hypothetical protein
VGCREVLGHLREPLHSAGVIVVIGLEGQARGLSHFTIGNLF